jgi:hypothetical protein
MIDSHELVELGIEVPRVGELIDILYVESIYNGDKYKEKASRKMHILKYAQLKELQLDIEEYVNLFRTSAVRISMCAFLPQDVDTLDPPLFKSISKDANTRAKDHFSLKHIQNAKVDQIVVTLRDSRTTRDCQAVRETVSFITDRVYKAIYNTRQSLSSHFNASRTHITDANSSSPTCHGFSSLHDVCLHLAGVYPIELMITVASKQNITQKVQLSTVLDMSVSKRLFINEITREFDQTLIQKVKDTPLPDLELFILASVLAHAHATAKSLKSLIADMNKPSFINKFPWRF